MDYAKVGTLQEFEDVNHKTVKLLGRLVGIIKRDDGSFFAIEASCKHQGANLLGEYTGGEIACCPRHKWKYDLTNGECLTNDSPPLKKYGVQLDGDTILVTLLPLPTD